MTGQNHDGEKVLHISGRADPDEELRYEIALLSNGEAVKERVLARAASGQLAQAIFNAAKSEHPGARIVLRRDMRILVDSSSK